MEAIPLEDERVAIALEQVEQYDGGYCKVGYSYPLDVVETGVVLLSIWTCPWLMVREDLVGRLEPCRTGDLNRMGKRRSESGRGRKRV